MTFFKEALSLAESVKGNVSPRPPVGAVIVKNSKIVGRGRTTSKPIKHAEIMAMEEAGENCQGSVLYTTLEPCSHYGKTPPCVKKIKSSNVKKVFFSKRT